MENLLSLEGNPSRVNARGFVTGLPPSSADLSLRQPVAQHFRKRALATVPSDQTWNFTKSGRRHDRCRLLRMVYFEVDLLGWEIDRLISSDDLILWQAFLAAQDCPFQR